MPSETKTRTSPPTSLAAAYRHQNRLIECELANGRRLGGYKVGLTAPSLQSAFGTDSPVRGVIFHDAIFRSGFQLDVQNFNSPRLEVELAFTLHRQLIGENITEEEVADAVDEIALALEIVDSRGSSWPGNAIELVSDNSAAAAAVLGRPIRYIGQDLAEFRCSLEPERGAVQFGRSDAVLGNPLTALTWLARALSASGDALNPCEVILSGTWLPPVAITGPQRYRASSDLLGEVSVAFR